ISLQRPASATHLAPFPYATLFRSDPRVARDGPGGIELHRLRLRGRKCAIEQGGIPGTRLGGSVEAAAEVLQRGIVIRGPLAIDRSEDHTSELQSLTNLVCRLLLEK